MNVFSILNVASFDYFFSICIYFLIFLLPVGLALVVISRKLTK